MILGVLPAVGSGLDTMARAGQLGRLGEYMRAWRGGFEVRYFSYLNAEVEFPCADRLADHQANGSIDTFCLLCNPWRLPPWRAIFRPLGKEREWWHDLSAIRCLNLVAAIPALTANLVWRTPFVVSLGADYEAIARIHGDGGQVWKWRLLRALVLRRAAAVIVPNPVQAARLQARHPRARIVDLPNWVDTEHFCPRPRPEAAPPNIVLCWGRLVAEKNLPRAARACIAAGAVLGCIGDGPERNAIIRAGGMVKASVSHDLLPTATAYAFAFILPSLSEGHPKALLEAMALGHPCLVSDRVEGVVEHERTALVFGAKDEASMRAAIERLLRDPALARRLGQAARAEAEAKYAKAPILAREVALLREVAR